MGTLIPCLIYQHSYTNHSYLAAPPAFIQRLPPYTGAMSEAAQFSVQCQVECSPLCDVFWLKDGAPIADDDDRYTIRYTIVLVNYY